MKNYNIKEEETTNLKNKSMNLEIIKMWINSKNDFIAQENDQ